MADLDYTNIAGSAFQPYVATQIEKRKALINKDYRSSLELNWLSNKNVWIRISSGANVKYGNKRYQGLEGDELSKKYILQGGVLNHLGGADSYTLRSGVGPDGAYGIGGTAFGLVPMPGLIDISIKTGGKLGTLKETTFNFVCHNIEQLNIMEALYMKLGFGILVEWGHTYYIDNKTESIQSNPLPLPFYGIHTKEDLLEKITAQRKKYSGNYDATWGTVKNFSYTLDGNGRFKCQVQLVGAGDILESLKVNLSGEFSNTENLNLLQTQLTSSIYPVVSDQNLSLLNSALFNMYSKDVITGDNIPFKVETNDNYLTSIEPFFNNLNLKLGNNWINNNELVSKGYNYRLINEPNLKENVGKYTDTKVPPIYYPSSFFGRLIMGYEIDGEGLNNDNDDTKPGLEQVYITLGCLLLLIMSTGMLYQYSETETPSKKSPYVYIDVNPETNRCYTFPGHCSLDPSICLIGSTQLPFGITSQTFEDIKANFNWFDDNGTGGRFMYTLVNINYVASLMKKWRATNTKGDVYFIDLVKDILDGISKATGGYNEFRIVPDDESNCIRILDDRRTVGPGQPIPEYTEIPILGKKSIVYNFDYTSKISPNTAGMVVVAAQAQPYGVQGAENALAFSHLNKGLYNRLNTVTVDSATELNQNANTDNTNNTVQRYVELRDYIRNIYDGVGGASALSTEEANEVLNQAESGSQNSDVLVKEALLKRTTDTYNEMIALANGLPNEGEIAELTRVYNLSLARIEKLSAQDVINELSVERNDQGNIIIPSETQAIWIHNLFLGKSIFSEIKYKSPNLIEDTEIEKKWTSYAQKQTGIPLGSFY
jgi:hypothetical protein